MDLSNFNFASPGWLWALLLIPIGFGWYRFANKSVSTGSVQKLADPKLLPHILLSKGKTVKNIKVGWLYSILIACVVIALANPRWSFTEVDAYQPSASAIILFDLSDSSSVNATRQRIEDLINDSKGLKLGLVAFAGNAYTVTPVTDDLNTLKNFLPALDTDIINKNGDNLRDAVIMAKELLKNEPGDNKSIILVSNGAFTSNNYINAIKTLPKNGIDLYVVGVGDVDKISLQSIAKDGKGLYVTANHSEQGINKIIHKISERQDSEHLVAGKIKQWDDRYYLFLIPAALMMLMLLRHHALLILPMFILVPEAQALGLFSNTDQQAREAYHRQDYSTAAEKFTSEYNKGVALYRSGKFSDAEAVFRQHDSLTATYNMGNSQMQQQK